MKPWAHVEQDPVFHQLPHHEQLRVRHAYLEKAETDPAFQQLPPDQQDIVRQRIMPGAGAGPQLLKSLGVEFQEPVAPPAPISDDAHITAMGHKMMAKPEDAFNHFRSLAPGQRAAILIKLGHSEKGLALKASLFKEHQRSK